MDNYDSDKPGCLLTTLLWTLLVYGVLGWVWAINYGVGVTVLIFVVLVVAVFAAWARDQKLAPARNEARRARLIAKSTAKIDKELQLEESNTNVEMPSRVTKDDIARLGELLAQDIERVSQLLKYEQERREREAAQSSRSIDDSIRYKAPPGAVGNIYSEMRNAQAFSRVVVRMVSEKCGGRASICYKRAGLSRQVYSHLISNPGSGVAKLTVMRLALGLQLTYEESVKFMASSGYAFSNSDKTDAVFSYCIKNRILSVFDVNELLVAVGCSPMEIN